jgi:hypothetical protein
MHFHEHTEEEFKWRERQIFELAGVFYEFDAGPAMDELPDQMREKDDKSHKRS